jgi:L-threonylcarbamoyladenylate synthase
MVTIEPTAQGVEEALAIVRCGGVVAHATETCYGLACDLSNPKAVAKLFAIKKRAANQPVSALFSSLEEAKKYVMWNGEAEELARTHLPGPLTIILPLREDAPRKIAPIPEPQDARTLGIRISSHPIAQKLVEKFGSPISTTSANIHGQSPCYSAEEISAQFEGEKDAPDLILDSGTIPKTPASTIVDLAVLKPKIHRQGSTEIPGRVG